MSDNKNSSPLKHVLRKTSGRARRCTVTLPHGKMETPCFMAVGTLGTIKALTAEEVAKIGYQTILGNTYHLGNRPGTDLMVKMVSLSKLSRITEVGVRFKSFVDSDEMVLTPEGSMYMQNCIGADIMMALDDVVSAVQPDKKRVRLATYRTTRWLDRCIAAHERPDEQALFGIVQGGLHQDLREVSLSHLRKRNLPGYAIGGLSGGEKKDDFWRVVELCTRSDGTGLPADKPRYLMGVGYPLDLVVCVALGVDMFDCVFPTRTARFGTALAPEGNLRLRMRKFETDFRVIEEGCPCEACSSNISRAYLHQNIVHEQTATRLVVLHNLTYMYRLGEKMRAAIEVGAYESFVVEFLKKMFKSGLIQNPEESPVTPFDGYVAWPPTKNVPEGSEEVFEEEEDQDGGSGIIGDMSNQLDKSAEQFQPAESTVSPKKNAPTDLDEVAPAPPLWVRDSLLAAGINILHLWDWSNAASAAVCGQNPHDAKPHGGTTFMKPRPWKPEEKTILRITRRNSKKDERS